LTEWSLKWRNNGWKTSSGGPVLNKELIDYILTLLETRQRAGQPVQLEYVKGHSGDVGNDGADAMAVAGCARPVMPDRDWVGLKETYSAEQSMMMNLMDIDPAVRLALGALRQPSRVLTNATQDFILSDEDLMRELEEDG